MKHLNLILSLIILFSVAVNAQDENEKSVITPSKGSLSFEVDFIPFSNSGPISVDAIKGRYFLNDKYAVRANFNFDSRKIHDENPSSYQNILVFDTQDGKYNVFGLGAGMEYHFLPDSRVSPYVGVNFTYEMKRANYEAITNVFQSYQTNEYTEVKTEVENAWSVLTIVGYDQYGNPRYSSQVQERAYNRIRAEAVLGADVYILKHLYMGVELGLGLNSTKYKEVIIKTDGNLETKYPETTDREFGLVFNNAIRLGFWF
jgi:outer membrane protein with beta-barrel domain